MKTLGEAMKCEDCGAPTMVFDSRAHALGIRRLRRCSNGHSFPTLEVRARRQGAGEGTREYRIVPEEMPTYAEMRSLFMQH